MSRRAKIEAMLQDTPDDPELNYFLALEFLSEGSLEQGLALLEGINQKSPDYIPAYVQAGQLLTKLGRDQDACALFKVGIEQARKVGDHHAAGEMAGFLDAIS